MKFINTSEQLPKKKGTYHVQWLSPERKIPAILTACEFNGKKFVVGDNGVAGTQPHQWLDVNAREDNMFTYGEMFGAVNNFYGSDYSLQRSQLDSYLEENGIKVTE